jgi:hypothetical protein
LKRFAGKQNGYIKAYLDGTLFANKGGLKLVQRSNQYIDTLMFDNFFGGNGAREAAQQNEVCHDLIVFPIEGLEVLSCLRRDQLHLAKSHSKKWGCMCRFLICSVHRAPLCWSRSADVAASGDHFCDHIFCYILSVRLQEFGFSRCILPQLFSFSFFFVFLFFSSSQ